MHRNEPVLLAIVIAALALAVVAPVSTGIRTPRSVDGTIVDADSIATLDVGEKNDSPDGSVEQPNRTVRSTVGRDHPISSSSRPKEGGSAASSHRTSGPDFPSSRSSPSSPSSNLSSSLSPFASPSSPTASKPRFPEPGERSVRPSAGDRPRPGRRVRVLVPSRRPRHRHRRAPAACHSDERRRRSVKILTGVSDHPNDRQQWPTALGCRSGVWGVCYSIEHLFEVAATPPEIGRRFRVGIGSQAIEY